MYLKHIDVGVLIVVFIISVVQNHKMNPQGFRSRQISDIVRNISRVNNLLENLIRNFEQLEQINEKDNDQSDSDAVSEVKDIFNEYAGKRANVEEQITTISQKNKSSSSQYGHAHDDLFAVKSLEDKTKLNTDDSSENVNVRVNLRADTNFGDENENESVELWKPNKNTLKQITTLTNKKIRNHTPRMSAVHRSDAEDDTTMQKEMSRAKTLRQAYEHACMKVLQRKCDKALESVLKDVCSSKRKCTGDFRKAFKNNSVTGCKQQFGKQVLTCRMGHDDSEFGAIPGRQETSERHKTDDITKDFNILRTKYENACKLSHSKRCQAACKYAASTTCKEQKCDDKKEEAFDKSAEKRCRKSYGAPKSDDTDDDSDSDDYDGWN